MINIGLDLSINSSGICIEHNGKYQWLLVVAAEKPDKMCRKLSELNDVTVITYERTGDNLKDGARVGKIIVESIKELQRIWKDNDLTVVKEDYAYSAQWNTLVQLVEHSSMIVYSIETELNSTVHKIAPKHIKKAFTNNGNASKTDMHCTFCREDLKGPFHNFCKQWNKEQKHVNDCIDAYAILKTIEKEDELTSKTKTQTETD